MISYSTRRDKTYGGFDEILDRLKDGASLAGLLRSRIRSAATAHGRPPEVWWCDDEPAGNATGMKLLREALGGKEGVRELKSPEAFADALRRGPPPILVITKYKGDEGRFAFPVLEAARPTSTPVIVFGGATKDLDLRRWNVPSRRGRRLHPRLA